MYAVFKTGGKQYRASQGEKLKIEKLNAAAGDTVEFGDVLHKRPLRLGVAVISASDTISLAGKSPSKASMQSSTCASLSKESREMAPVVSNRRMEAADTPDLAASVSLDKLVATRRARACWASCCATSLGVLNDNIVSLI